MNSKRFFVLAAMAAATALPFANGAFAAEADDINAFVTQCDTNKDGMISKAELMQQVERAWTMADTGKKGVIDKTQAQIFLKELMRSGA